jgi:hypothetical protein
MHTAIERSVQGFIQVWEPFVNGSIAPLPGAGAEVVRTADGPTIHAPGANGGKVTEVFSNALLLQRYSLDLSSAQISIAPAFHSTGRGLLVDHLQVRAQPAGTPAQPTDLVRFAVDYQDVEGNPVPARFNMAVEGSPAFDVAFDRCTLRRAGQ